MKLSSIQTFQPRNWILLSCTLFFLLPALVAALFSRQVKGYGYLNLDGAMASFWLTLLMALTFVGITLVTMKLVPSNLRRQRMIHAVTRSDMALASLLFLVGLVATLALAARGGGEMRSNLVAGATGQILYALSFFLTSGFLALAAGLLNRNRYGAVTALILLFGLSLVMLGGRGRVLWPLVALFAAHHISHGKSIRVGRFVFIALALLALMSLLDPLYFLLTGTGQNVASAVSFELWLHNTFVHKRNFDGFFNLFMIVHYDPFPASLSYLIDGPRQTFMGYFFPSILDRGIGFPATVPGTFWMTGGGVYGLLAGAIIYGLFAGLVTRWYFRTQSQLVLCFLCYEFTWIFNVGSSLFDHTAKIIASSLAFLPFVLLRLLAQSQGRAVVPNRAPSTAPTSRFS